MIRKLILSFFKPSLEQEIEEALARRKQLRLAGYARPYLRRGA